MLVILDRDGVINYDSDAYIKSPDEWIAIPNSIEAIALLSQAGHRVVIATNQSGLARKLYSLETLEKIHQKMCDAITKAGGHVDGIYFCPHLPDDNCDCRKPKPGLLHQIQGDFQVNHHDMIFIGDSLRDYEAARAFGCAFVLVKTGNGQRVCSQHTGLLEVPVFDDLHAWVVQVCQ